jgi:hypothetical protein
VLDDQSSDRTAAIAAEYGPQSLAWAVTNMEWHEADCISGCVFQEMSALGEQFIVPATYIMSAMILPLWLIAALPAPGLSFAIGQMIMFRREAFEAIGGYARVRGAISDDLARHLSVFFAAAVSLPAAWALVLYPVLYVHLLYMAWWSVSQAGSGRGVVWKGRTLR